MNWFRDNIVKIIIVLVIATLVVVFFVACSGKDNTPGVEKGNAYTELENKVQSAALKYVNKHKNLLPKNTSNDRKINLDTLINAKMLKEIHAIEDSKIVCSGYVIISKKSEDKDEYRYTPYIKCGKYYTTRTIGDYIITKEEIKTSGDGLYKFNDNEYYYRGEYPNNYIKLDDREYRILSISSDGYLKLISGSRTGDRYLWDDRFNSSVNKYYGITDFAKSRIKQSLIDLYNNEDEELGEVYFTTKEKSYIIDHDFCVGGRSEDDKGIYSSTDCDQLSNQKVGLLGISEYYRVSLDSGCTGIDKLECNNYNFLFRYADSYVFMNRNLSNSYTYYLQSDGNLEVVNANKGNRLYPVVYINNNYLYYKGTGTQADPYIIR